MKAVGILGIGKYLPPEIRRNDWWPAEVVERWAQSRPAAPPPVIDGLGAMAARVLEELGSQAQDPFQGAVERHVMGDESITDMEQRAAQDAIDRAGIDASAIDLVLTHTATPEYLLSNPAAMLHERLGLRAECFAMQTESAAYGFMHQLTLAQAMIEAGRARYALLVQSSSATKLCDPHDALAPYFGDGATAVVVGPVRGGGIRASVHYTDGRFSDTLVAGVPGGAWYDPQRSIMHIRDPGKMRTLLLRTVDLLAQSVGTALERAGCGPADVRLLCIHQGTPWLRRLTQEATGLTAAHTIETFTKTGYLFSAILPLGLRIAEDEALVKRGDTVVLLGGGTGTTYGATVIDWGGSPL